MAVHSPGARLTRVNGSPRRARRTGEREHVQAEVEDLAQDAVQLGLGYPKGPLGWGDQLGAARILAILQAQLAVTGDPRYRPSAWLARRVALGLPLTMPEAAR